MMMNFGSNSPLTAGVWARLVAAAAALAFLWLAVLWAVR
jgi:hypothetical protein